MKGLLTRAMWISSIALISIQMAYSEPLQGNVGVSPQWGSGWIALARVTDFKQGDKLRLRIGGSATKIVIRFLAAGIDSNTPSGIDGDIIEVPQSRNVEIILKEDHKNVEQISVHGGPNPWGLFPLGAQNGPAMLLSAERIATQGK